MTPLLPNPKSTTKRWMLSYLKQLEWSKILKVEVSLKQTLIELLLTTTLSLISAKASRAKVCREGILTPRMTEMVQEWPKRGSISITHLRLEMMTVLSRSSLTMTLQQVSLTMKMMSNYRKWSKLKQIKKWQLCRRQGQKVTKVQMLDQSTSRPL